MVTREFELFGTVFGQATFLHDDRIIQVTLGKDHFRSFLQSLMRSKHEAVEALPDAPSVPIRSVTRLRITYGEPVKADIDYRDDAGKRQTLEVTGDKNATELDALTARLVGARSNRDPDSVKPNESRVSPFVAGLKPLAAVVIVGFLGMLLYQIADPSVSVDVDEIDGGHAGKAKVLVWLSETVGQAGVAVVGIPLWLLTVVGFLVQVRNRPRIRTWVFPSRNST